MEELTEAVMIEIAICISERGFDVMDLHLNPTFFQRVEAMVMLNKDVLTVRETIESTLGACIDRALRCAP
jgi:hypothetical protein